MPEQTDHDVLVAVSVKLDRVISDVADLKDNLVSRVECLEKDKLDEGDFLQTHKEIEDRFIKNEDDIGILKTWRAGMIATSTVLGGLITWFIIKLYEHISIG